MYYSQLKGRKPLISWLTKWLFSAYKILWQLIKKDTTWKQLESKLQRDIINIKTYYIIKSLRSYQINTHEIFWVSSTNLAKVFFLANILNMIRIHVENSQRTKNLKNHVDGLEHCSTNMLHSHPWLLGYYILSSWLLRLLCSLTIDCQQDHKLAVINGIKYYLRNNKTWNIVRFPSHIDCFSTMKVID